MHTQTTFDAKYKLKKLFLLFWSTVYVQDRTKLTVLSMEMAYLQLVQFIVHTVWERVTGNSHRLLAHLLRPSEHACHMLRHTESLLQEYFRCKLSDIPYLALVHVSWTLVEIRKWRQARNSAQNASFIQLQVGGTLYRFNT